MFILYIVIRSFWRHIGAGIKMLFFVNIHKTLFNVSTLSQGKSLEFKWNCIEINFPISMFPLDHSLRHNGVTAYVKYFQPSPITVNTCTWIVKMLYLIGPDGLVNWGFVNFQIMVWMTTVHVLRFKIKHQKSSEIMTVFRPLPVRGHVRALFLEEFRDAHSLNLGMHIIHIHAVFLEICKFAYQIFP